jgi:tetratricopeptide (TPR) repeat protein
VSDEPGRRAPDHHVIAFACAALALSALAWAYRDVVDCGLGAFGDAWLVGGHLHTAAARVPDDVASLFSTRGEMRRPLFWLAIDAAQSLTANSAAAIHGATRLLHALTFAGAALLGAAMLRRASRPTEAGFGPAVVAAALWSLHPVHAETVASAATLGVVLGTALVLAGALFRSLAPERPAARPVSIALLGLGLAANPLLCFAPIAYLALARATRKGDAATGRAPADLVVAFALGALSLVATMSCRETGGGPPPLAAVCATASALIRPLRAMLWPLVLHPAYDAPAGVPLEIAPSLWIDAATAAALCIACAVGVRRRTGWGNALLAYLALAAGPALFARDPVGSDPAAYAATIPLAVAAAIAVAGFPVAVRGVVLAGAVAAAVWLTVRTAERIAPFKDEETLARRVVEIDPTNERALVALGDEARRAGAPVADLVHWYGVAAGYGDWRSIARARRGAALLETGDVDGARTDLARAVAIAPWLAPARFDLGALELREGHLEAAQTQFEAAARLDDESADSWRLLARARDAAGDREGAAAAMRRAVRLRPGDAGLAEALRRYER